MREPLRVMQLALSLVIGGTEKLVYDIARRVEQPLISSVVCCLDQLGFFGEELQREGFSVYALNRQPGIDWSVIKKLRAIIRQEKIDVIHAHQYTPYFYGLLGVLSCKPNPFIKPPRIIFTEHGRFYPDQRKIKRVLVNPILSLFTDEIVTISECTKTALIKYENFPAHRIRVVYNGIDPDKFSQTSVDDVVKKKHSLGLPANGKVIGIVARLDPIKNHAMLLKAFKIVLRHIPGTSLLIVGSGPEEQTLKNLAQSFDLTNNVVFLGARNDVAELLHIFDVFALSSFSEGTSVTLLEAMGVGVPIVATRVGGNPEVVKDQETGFLVESDNEDNMAQMCIKLLENETLCQKMGEEGRRRVQEMFTLDTMVKTYTELYFSVSK